MHVNLVARSLAARFHNLRDSGISWYRAVAESVAFLSRVGPKTKPGVCFWNRKRGSFLGPKKGPFFGTAFQFRLIIS